MFVPYLYCICYPLRRNVVNWKQENLSGPRDEDDDDDEDMEEEGAGSEEEKEDKDDKEEKKEEDMVVEEEHEPEKPEKPNAKLNLHLLECVKDVNDGKVGASLLSV